VPFLVRSIAVVVTPLVSLMIYQRANISQKGLKNFWGKLKKMTKVLDGDIQLVYISLLLNHLSRQALVVDEMHCVNLP